MYLGKQRGRVFFPSFNLLAIIAKARGNEVIVDEKTEWLFICGRDIFKRGIISVTGSLRKGNYTLVLNSHRECLGFGETLCDLSEARDGVAVKNVLDLGDFLRREKGDPRKRS
jgi:ribosome biogenesis protein Nip4